MYLPYLRGRGSELLALRALAQKLSKSGKCLPVIEPVNDDLGALKRAIEIALEKKATISVVLNPTVGDLINSPKKILTAIEEEDKENKVILGICITSSSAIPRLTQIANIVNGRKVLLVHHGAQSEQEALSSAFDFIKDDIVWQIFREGRIPASYRSRLLRLGGNAALLEDKFILRDKNADYDDTPDEHYSDLVYNFQSLGYKGFGDYLTIGERFSKGGGPAHAIALHLTYPVNKSGNKSVWIRHFVSDDKTGPKNPGGKFLQALRKLVTFYRANKADLDFSDACREFEDLYVAKKFPGLPKLKEISMKHHIELMLHEQ